MVTTNIRCRTSQLTSLVRRLFILALFAIVFLLVQVSQRPVLAAPLLIFAAASLQGTLDKSVLAFGRRNKVTVRIAYGSSGILARQIERRAPADIYISASTQWMNYLERQKSLIAGSRINLLSNKLVLIARNSEQTHGTIPGLPLVKLVGTGRLATGDPDHVPAGIYAKAALIKLGLWAGIKNRLARAGNVRSALALVARGEARFGIVYRSDALAERRVKIVASFPSDSHPAIVYPAAMINGANVKNATALLAYLVSTPGRAPFLAAGFDAPPGP